MDEAQSQANEAEPRGFFRWEPADHGALADVA